MTQQPLTPRQIVQELDRYIIGQEEAKRAEEEAKAEAERLALEKYRSWDWNFGASPKYTERRARRFSWGRVEVFYDVARGRIASARVMGDFFAARDPAEFCGALKGRPRRPQELLAYLKTLPLDQWFAGCHEAELAAFLAEL